MANRTPSRLAFVIPAVVCLALGVALAVQMYEGLMSDFYWTPADQAPGLDQAADRIEVYLEGDLLQRRAERGEILDAEGAPIPADAFRVRMNNQDRVQRVQLALLAAMVGAGVAFLVAALLQPGRRGRSAR